MISIVVPLYNKAHTIENTLRTVLNQTFVNYEVILVNDGSTDNGALVVQKFLSDSRFRLVNQYNQGVSVARNRGVEESKYEYIAFLDGDDEWLPEYLTKMVEAINLFSDAGLYCCAGFVKDRGGNHLRLAEKYKNKILEIDFFENPHVFLHTSAAIVDKSVFNKTNGFPAGMKRNQDFALFFSVALLTRVVYCGFPLSIYVGDVEGQTTKTPGLQVLSHIVNRYNHVFRNYIALDKKNKSFEVFCKYELRHQIIGFLKGNDYNSIKVFFDSLDMEIKHLFLPFELFIYSNKSLKLLALIIIYSSKIRWRMRGYPRVK
jgi:glycosyltransferase involved in cell wall biosynthesis